jgi:ferredoxin-NADP reductase/Na+-translocating ferredoxin:NAD+ oxidoreductase RnfD subunit
MRRLVEGFIDSFTMYRLVLYGLYLLVSTSIGLSIFGLLSFTPISLILTLLVLYVFSYAANRLFSWTFSVPYNPESWQITALIIFFLIFPQSDFRGLFYVAIVAAISMASKYVLVFRGRHIFNPAAIAVVISGLLGLLGAVWWVGTLFMLPSVLIVGLLVAWKLRNFWMIGVYMFTAVALSTILAKISGNDGGEAIKNAIISGPIIFAGTIMLTEPLTSPTTKRSQIVYAVLVGALSGLRLGWLSKPDVAISIGNVFAFMLGSKRAIKFKYIGSRLIAPSIYEIVLRPVHKLRFRAGQYIELTLPHDKTDDRGIRRAFSFASAPSSNEVQLGMVIPAEPSSFKRELMRLKPGNIISATQVAGSFVLPRDSNMPLVFIAGGIGITPFASMLEDLMARRDRRQITLFYSVKSQDMAAYSDIIIRAQREIGLRVVVIVSQPTVGWSGESGRLNTEKMTKYVNNLMFSRIYISGPNALVESFKADLKDYGVSGRNIMTDHFSGY